MVMDLKRGRSTLRVAMCAWGVATCAPRAEASVDALRHLHVPSGGEALRSPDGSPTFGVAVAAAGEWIAIGDDRTADGLVDSGRVHLHRRSPAGRWLPTETIGGRTRVPFDRFGVAVAMTDERMVVGAPGPDGVGGGVAEVFRRNGGRWHREAVLADPSVGPLDRFGIAVAIAGDLVVVASPRRDSPELDAGGVAVFTRTGAGWGAATWLSAPDAAAGDRFGSSVATDGERVVVGAVGDDDLGEKSGAAWVFLRGNDGWRAEAKLLPPHGGSREWFGHAVAIDGASVLVGSPRADPQGPASGTVWAFALDENGWSAVSEVPALDGRAGDWFGADLAIAPSNHEGHEQIAIVGRPGREVVLDGVELEDAGDAIVLDRIGRRWGSAGPVEVETGDAVRLRGSSVAVSDAAFVLGHRPVEDGPTVPGEVWVLPRQ